MIQRLSLASLAHLLAYIVTHAWRAPTDQLFEMKSISFQIKVWVLNGFLAILQVKTTISGSNVFASIPAIKIFGISGSDRVPTLSQTKVETSWAGNTKTQAVATCATCLGWVREICMHEVFLP